MRKRSSGILVHITSLPGKHGVGDFGPGAYAFADFLSSARQSYWQVLPLNAPSVNIPHSPYSCLSAFAGDPLLISPELLRKQGLLSNKDMENRPGFGERQVDFRSVIPYKARLMKLAYKRFASSGPNAAYKRFCRVNECWLEDYAFFVALRSHFKPRMWYDWPGGVRDRHGGCLEPYREKLKDVIGMEKFLQYQFFSQWFALKDYCRQKGIGIIGDLPIYLSCDSADLWVNPHIFKLNKNKKPAFVSGVPPDYFCKEGQLWGNPVYDWKALKKQNYSWWLDRIGHNLKMFDVVRLDHFRGFVSYWQVPAGHKIAAKGKWIRAPKDTFFAKILDKYSAGSLLAEDLGFITPAVRAFMDKLKLPGMRVLLYGFDGDKNRNVHYIKNHVKNCIAYTGTHDNNTIRGWFENEAGDEQKLRLSDLLGHKINIRQLHWDMIALAMSSAANVVIIPMQDILGLDAKARMNLPGSTARTNWAWRLGKGQITHSTIDKLREFTEQSARCVL